MEAFIVGARQIMPQDRAVFSHLGLKLRAQCGHRPSALVMPSCCDLAAAAWGRCGKGQPVGVPQILCKLLLNKGDSILVEEYTYAHMVESTIQLHGFKAVPVAMDAQGSPFSLPPPPPPPGGAHASARRSWCPLG